MAEEIVLKCFDDILEFAVKVHKKQTDRHGNPFILHSLSVMIKMNTENERIIALLHDVVENTHWTLDQVKNKLGLTENIVQALDCLTRRENESYEDMIRRVIENDLAIKVKTADLENNMDIKRIQNVSDLKQSDLDRFQQYLDTWKKLIDL